MKALVLTDIKKIEIKEIKIPEIKENEVLINVMETGICGSDLLVYRGKHPYKTPPTILGHELCGIVKKIGDKVKNIKIGDKVIAESYSSCDSCFYCKKNKMHLCSNKKVSSYENWNGSFAEYFIAPENCIYKIPKKISFSDGVMIEPLAIALHALNLTAIKGKEIVILGAGNIGLSCLVCAKKLGAKKVICSDINDFKEKIIKKIGFGSFVNVRKENLSEVVKNEFIEGADITIIAGEPTKLIDDAVSITKKGGEVIIISYFEDRYLFDFNKLVKKEITLVGSSLSCKEDIETIIRWMDKKEIDVAPLITHSFPLEMTPEAMKLMDEKRGERGKIILKNRNL